MMIDKRRRLGRFSRLGRAIVLVTLLAIIACATRTIPEPSAASALRTDQPEGAPAPLTQAFTGQEPSGEVTPRPPMQHHEHMHHPGMSHGSASPDAGSAEEGSSDGHHH
jgi:hypothetical protein